jgi:class 3 adenylate cyclase/tetratricopeptide (TPR) repeat protein
MPSCLACGSDSPEHANFCGRCGAKLPVAARPTGERRHITVLFVDLVGSTQLSASLDPEDYREVVHVYQAKAASIVDRFEGRIAQYLGDGLLVYFGHPRAHEDDARRAVHAGLLITAAVNEIDVSRWRLSESLTVRIGIHTGLVVIAQVGEGQHQELLALGETPNVAARLQTIALPGSVVVSGDTQHLIHSVFDLRAMGERELKGVPRPVRVYEVLSDLAVPAWSAVPVLALTPLVDRRDERARLESEWLKARGEGGRVVLISGAPGMGKSRLVSALREHIGAREHVAIVCQCLPYFANSALYPFIEGLRRLLAIPPGASDGLLLLARSAARYGLRDREDVATLATLLGIPLDERYPGSGSVSPQRQKERTYEALISLVCEIASRRPLLFLLEDAHWADPSTLELLGDLIARGLPRGLLLILTSRESEVAAAFPGDALHLHVTPLGSEHVAEIAGLVARRKRLPDRILEEVIAKTGGTPLFVEELTKMVLGSGALVELEEAYELTGPIDHLATPVTLMDSLTARLDQLGEHRGLAQVAAVVGREFSEELLTAVTDLEEEALRSGLEALVKSELVERKEEGRVFAFRHALLQEAAYESVLRTTRRSDHMRIAMALENQFPDVVTSRPELIARHFTEASAPQRAIPYWRRAADRSVSRSANREAVTFFRSALQLVASLPESPERDAQELALLTSLGAPLISTEGYASGEVARVYERARQICERLDEEAQVFPIIFGLLAFYLARGELKVAERLGERLLHMTERAGDPAYLEAHFALGMTRFYLGAFDPSRRLLTRGAELHDPFAHKSLASLYVFDPGTGCRRALGLVLWLLGYGDDAARRSTEAIELGERQDHPYGLAAALVFAAMLWQFRGEPSNVAELAERALAISTERGFAFWIRWAGVLRAWADAAMGKGTAAHVRERADASAKSGALLLYPYHLALAAEAFLREGNPEEGLAATAEALAIAGRTGERWWEPEIHRLNAQLLSIGGAPHEDVRLSMAQAVTLAREMGAVALERRALKGATETA